MHSAPKYVVNEHYFSFKKATLCYSKEGDGKEILLAFPGFGQSHRIFSSLVEKLGREITLYSFDLFFHGNSDWGYGEYPVTKVFWKELLETFLKVQGIERFSVVGFSLGARFALASFEALPERINQLFLIAPDGLYSNGWYTLATSTFLARRLFKSFTELPGMYFSLSSLLGRLRILNPRLLRFAEHQMRSLEMRKKVYYSWVVFRRLSNRKKSFQTAVQQYPDAVTILLGRHDTVITPKSIVNVLGFPSPVKLVLLEAGHNTLISSFIEGNFLFSNRIRD